jgi:adenosine deaminase
MDQYGVDVATEFVSLPKVLLHDHLDGGLRIPTIIELAAEQGYTKLPTTDPDDLASWFHRGAARRSLELYLETFEHTVAVMSTPEAIARISYESAVDLANDGVVYAESRFAPELVATDAMPIERVLAAIRAGFELAETETGIVMRTIVCSLRHLGISATAATAAVNAKDQGVVGFDIAGPEAGFPAADHAEAFAIAKAGGLHLTIHAGEAFGLSSIKEALKCGAERLGHGVRIVDDIISEHPPTFGPVATMVRERSVCLEVCPTSNIHTAAAGVTSLADHPIGQLERDGFAVTVNTDNRLMSNVSLSDEYAGLAAAFGWDAATFARTNATALDAAFCDDQTKQQVNARLSD